ncbi:MAG TPA: hypothetical protein VN256_13280 [Pyrinomonadaceae bacterium]|nr:hypothetical protein [Pyrinomonadaceae bacterium]
MPDTLTAQEREVVEAAKRFVKAVHESNGDSQYSEKVVTAEDELIEAVDRLEGQS